MSVAGKGGPDNVDRVDPAVLQKLAASIEAEFEKAPPTIAVVGLSGVGKSSVINAMFGTKRDVSATTRGTSNFYTRKFKIESKRVHGASLTCTLHVIDAPGLGEDAARDENYLKRYRQHLPDADVALWVVAARNRALALDQNYLEKLADVMPPVVLGISQVDLIDPLSWHTAINMPSKEQAENMRRIVDDRKQKFEAVFSRDLTVVPFSATKYYNLQALFKACLDAAPQKRRWMFEILKSFSTRDWLAQAKGLSPRQRQELEAKFLSSDRPMPLDAITL